MAGVLRHDQYQRVRSLIKQESAQLVVRTERLLESGWMGVMRW